MIPNDKATSAEIARHTYTDDTFVMPAVHEYNQDFENGTLSRISAKPRRIWAFLGPIVALVALAVYAALIHGQLSAMCIDGIC